MTRVGDVSSASSWRSTKTVRNPSAAAGRMSWYWLAAVLGRDREVGSHAELGNRGLQQVAIDIGEDRELSSAVAKRAQGSGHLWKRPPLGERRRQWGGLILADRDIERPEHTPADTVEDVLIEVVALGLELRLHRDVPLGEGLPVGAGRKEWQERVGDPALPVDERAVAVERDPIHRHGPQRTSYDPITLMRTSSTH